MIYGWDISTSIVGVSIFKNDGTYMASGHCDLRKVDGLLSKADEFKSWLDGSAVNVEPQNYHFIEERLGGFSGGRSSAQVLMKLGAFNTLASWILWTHRSGTHRSIVYLHPSTWKSVLKHEGLIIPKGADKKTLTLEWVRRKQPKFIVEKNRNDKPQPWCYDEADAYCIGRAGFLRLCKENENSLP